MAKVKVVTLGCKANQYDSEQLKKEFQNKGWEIVSGDQVPDIFLVNSCTVTNEASRQSRQRLRKMSKEGKTPFLVLYGCYPQAYPQQTEKIPGVDLVIGRQDFDKTVELIESASGIKPLRKKADQDLFFFNRTRAFLKIEEGCESFCSYCIVPRARGRVWSKPVDEILEEIEALITSGFKEVVLTGIHLGFYGKDRRGNLSLEKVIERILETPLPRLRLSSLEINEVSEELLDLMEGENALCPHLHLPLQSGSDKILEKMNRKYKARNFLAKTNYFKSRIPDLGLTTDVMVGFPGEAEEDFDKTVEMVKEVGFSRIHVFSYSKRAGTPAARMNQQITGPEKKKRNQFLRAIGEEQQAMFNSKYLGREMEVLVEGTEPTQGWSSNYIKYYFEEDLEQGELIKVKGEKLFQDGIWGKEV